MKNAARPTAAVTPEPAELIRAKLDAGFAAVQTGKMRSQMGLADAGAVTRAEVEKTVAIVRAAIQAAHFTESQLAVVNKKIQALKDAAGRIDTP
jgi:hypothetical protein